MPDIKLLVSAMEELARAMKCQPLASDYAEEFLDYMLYDRELFGLKGRNGWSAFVRGVITELELRNLLMAHCANTTAKLSNVDEPGCNTYDTRKLGLAFEIGLYGREAKLVAGDAVDHMNNVRDVGG